MSRLSLKDAIVVDALKHAKNALRDYIETIERKGASLNYGRSVIVKIDKAFKVLGVEGTDRDL